MAAVKIIDDDVRFAENLTGLLEHGGHTVSHMDTTDGAIEALSRDMPDLLILDVMFPEDPAAGLKLAQQIRRTPAIKNLPIILLTCINTEFPIGLSVKDIDDKWMPVQTFIEKRSDLAKLLDKVAALTQAA